MVTFSSLLLLPKDTLTDLLSLARSALARSRLPTCGARGVGAAEGVSQDVQRSSRQQGSSGRAPQCRAKRPLHSKVQWQVLTVPTSSFTSSRGLPGTTAAGKACERVREQAATQDMRHKQLVRPAAHAGAPCTSHHWERNCAAR